MPYNSAPQKKNVKIHGVIVEQIQLQGNYYTPVDARVKIAEQADPALIRREGAGYHVVSVEFVQLGDRWVYHCLVEYPAGSGVIKPGSDFIDMKDSAGVAKAETSAIGRALGLHGIAIDESIASAEEMRGVEPSLPQGQPATQPTPATQATQATQATRATPQRPPARQQPTRSPQPTQPPQTAQGAQAAQSGGAIPTIPYDLQLRHDTPEPAQSAQERMAEIAQKQAPDAIQQNLLNAMRQAGLDTEPKARAFLVGQLGEERGGAIDIGDLRMCRSALTTGECAQLSSALERKPATAAQAK